MQRKTPEVAACRGETNEPMSNTGLLQTLANIYRFSDFSEFLFRNISFFGILVYLCAMTREERILRFKYPGRESFTEDELRQVRRLLAKEGDKDEGAQRFPTRFVPVGGITSIFGRMYRCVPCDPDILTDPCRGCDLREQNCTSRVPQCSPFDRRDRKRVWFKLIKTKEK